MPEKIKGEAKAEGEAKSLTRRDPTLRRLLILLFLPQAPTRRSVKEIHDHLATHKVEVGPSGGGRFLFWPPFPSPCPCSVGGALCGRGH
jgi:hypothetical protein